MKSLLLLILLSTFNFCLGQSSGRASNCVIKGKIVDSATKTGIEYASVTAFLTGTEKVAGGIITDEKGAFKIENLATGEYYIKIDFIGYRSKQMNAITLSEAKNVADMGSIGLPAASRTMKEVTVTGSKNFMENHLDKFVFNVEKDVTAQGGVATDLLKKVPQVSVDVDGNIELLGSGNVRVFINGKPSTMFDNNLSEALQAIPANQIKSIEVITSPGAQYDAQGTGGIINIILKDNKAQGISGSVALSTGTRLENGSANIHAKKGKIDLSASLSGNAQLKGTTLSTLNRTRDTAQLLQNGTGTLEKNGYRGQLGMEWAISKKDNLSANLSYNSFGNDNTGVTNQSQLYPAADTNTVRNSYNTFRYNTLDFNLNYLRKFAREGQELSISLQSSNGDGTTYYRQNQRYSDSSNLFSGALGNNHLSDRETYLILDYAQPIKKDVILNVGAKVTDSRITSNSDHSILDPFSGIYAFDSSQNNTFNFNRDVYAGYASVTFPFYKGFTSKLGVRDEYTAIDIPGLQGATVPSYNSFIPSIVISKKLTKNQNIKFSYTKRIQRAGYRELNPFIDATDPTSLLQGNPYLKPERSDVFEVTYNRFFEKGNSILITAFSRNTRDDEQTYLYDTTITVGKTTYTNVAVITNENAGHQHLTGFNISGNLVLSNKLEIRGNANVFDKYIISELVAGTTINSINYRINANATYQFTKTLLGEFFGNFNSQRTEIQGKFPSFTSYSFALRQMLWKKKGSVAFTTTNPFNRYTNQATDVTGQNFTVTSNRKIPYQSFGLSFSYKFGKMEYKEKKQENAPSPEDGG